MVAVVAVATRGEGEGYLPREMSSLIPVRRRGGGQWREHKKNGKLLVDIFEVENETGHRDDASNRIDE